MWSVTCALMNETFPSKMAAVILRPFEFFENPTEADADPDDSVVSDLVESNPERESESEAETQ